MNIAESMFATEIAKEICDRLGIKYAYLGTKHANEQQCPFTLNGKPLYPTLNGEPLFPPNNNEVK